MRPRNVNSSVVTQRIQTGDATKLYTATLNHLQQSPWNDTRNTKTLAWMVTGLIQTGSSNPPDWIPSVQSQATRAQNTERRFSRWLTNKHITAQHVYTPLIIQALQDWGEYEFRLALDTSLIFETHCICLGPTAAPVLIPTMHLTGGIAHGLGPHPNRGPLPRSCRATRANRDCPCKCHR